MRTGLLDQCESMGWGTDRLQDMKRNVKTDTSLGWIGRASAEKDMSGLTRPEIENVPRRK